MSIGVPGYNHAENLWVVMGSEGLGLAQTQGMATIQMFG